MKNGKKSSGKMENCRGKKMDKKTPFGGKKKNKMKGLSKNTPV